MKLVNNTVERFKNPKLINKKVAEILKRNDPKTPKFYLRPKIHKEGNPDRPVVSSGNGHTEIISKYVDYHLQSIVKEIPSYVKDTQDFLKKLEKVKHIPQESLLVTFDVKSRHRNIPNNEGIKAVKESYEKYKEKTVSTKVIITFLSLILTLNNFVFNCIYYLQTMGCVIGTLCAPSYANTSIHTLKVVSGTFLLVCFYEARKKNFISLQKLYFRQARRIKINSGGAESLSKNVGYLG